MLPFLVVAPLKAHVPDHCFPKAFFTPEEHKNTIFGTLKKLLKHWLIFKNRGYIHIRFGSKLIMHPLLLICSYFAMRETS